MWWLSPIGALLAEIGQSRVLVCWDGVHRFCVHDTGISETQGVPGKVDCFRFLEGDLRDGKSRFARPVSSQVASEMCVGKGI